MVAQYVMLPLQSLTESKLFFIFSNCLLKLEGSIKQGFILPAYLLQYSQDVLYIL